MNASPRFTTIASEFPTYPQDSLPALIPPSWQDASWHNDVCPSFLINGTVRVWLDWPTAHEREFPDGARFTVTTEPTDEDSEGRTLFASDDWAAVLTFLKVTP